MEDTGQDDSIRLENDNNDIDEEETNNIGEDDGTDDYDEGVEFDESSLQKLKMNDPAIKSLYVRLSDGERGKFFNDGIDWKEDGDCITNNNHLKRLWIPYNGQLTRTIVLGEQRHFVRQKLPARQQLHDFFWCIYQNSSIDELGIYNCSIVNQFGGDLIKGLQGHPSITKLELERGRLGSVGCIAVGKVLKHPKCKLMELRLVGNNFNHEGFNALCNALADNKTLKKLFLSNNKQISTPAGWRALSTVLQSPNCKLVELDLHSTAMNDYAVDTLGSALRGSSVKALDLKYNHLVSGAGWQTFLNQLSQSSIQSLALGSTNIDNSGLGELANISTIKYLDLGWLKFVTPPGWQSFFNRLQRRGTQLKTLDVSNNNIGNEGIAALGSLLSTSSNTMETLVMRSMKSSLDHSSDITTQGWISFFNALQDSNLNLIKLNFGRNIINDEGMQLLVRLVSSMSSSLKELFLRENHSVTPAGWQALTGYLQSPNLVLKELELAENCIDDDTLVSFASALEHNKTLKSLALYACGTYDDDDEYTSLITEIGWEAVSTLLCDKTSIMDTYNSNHTLNYISYDDDDEDNVLDSYNHLWQYLELNMNKDKVEVARQKILQTHFSTEDETTPKTQELLDMELEVMPSVISWIGRPAHDNWKGTNESGLSLLYNLVRRVPDLFDLDAQKKPFNGKRKRETI